jgi:hypothetical protein
MTETPEVDLGSFDRVDDHQAFVRGGRVAGRAPWPFPLHSSDRSARPRIIAEDLAILPSRHAIGARLHPGTSGLIAWNRELASRELFAGAALAPVAAPNLAGPG